MADGGKSFDTCFRSSKRKAGSTPPLRAYFKQQSSPRSSYGALRKTNLFQAFLPQEVSHRFMFTNKTHCLLWAVLIWDTFQPKQFDTQSLLWRRLNWQYQWDPLPLVSCKALGYISAQTMWNTKPIVAAIKSICRWLHHHWALTVGSIYNLVLRHTFSVQLINVFLFVCLRASHWLARGYF